MSPKWSFRLAGCVALLAAALAYAPLLQAIPNGSDHYFMIDAGETQIVLNQWGTLHPTGYPLYVMTGAPLVAVMRALGIGAAAAPAVVSLLTLLAALAFVYALAARLTGRPWLAAAATVAFSLTRTVWIHGVIAEIYALMLLFLAIMLWIALAERRPETDQRRLYALALLGGLGVAHHRALAFAIPALLVAMWPVLRASPRALPRRLLACLALGLLGFLPYLWLPLRAQAGAPWVYGSPGTLTGFFDQFWAREAARFIGPPSTDAGLLANMQLVLNVLITDLTLPGLIAGVAGLVIALVAPHPLAPSPTQAGRGGGQPPSPTPLAQGEGRTATLTLQSPLPQGEGEQLRLPPTPFPQGEGSQTMNAALPPLSPLAWERGSGGEGPRREGLRRAALSLLLLAAAAFAFHAFAYTDVLSALILMITLPLALGWALLAARLLQWVESQTWAARWGARAGAAAVAALFAGVLVSQNAPFIQGLVTDPTGLHTIALAQSAPPDSTLMIPWGPRYFAVAFARDVDGTLRPDITLVDHRADFATLIHDDRSLVTLATTFYNQPVAWWEAATGGPVFLTAAAPDLVRIAPAPVSGESVSADLPEPAAVDLVCGNDALTLTVDWQAGAAPRTDWSVFVHSVDANGTLIAQGDQSAPVFGWRPLTTWTADEIVRDIYTVPRQPEATELKFGFYRQRADGSFENATEYRVEVACEVLP